ncbi:MAG: hypothetical protein PGN24_03735 [Microbacterium arborescens]
MPIRLALEADADRLADLAQEAWDRYRDLIVQRHAIELTLSELPDFAHHQPQEATAA